MPKEEILSHILRRAREEFNVRVAIAARVLRNHAEERAAVARASMTAAEVDAAERASWEEDDTPIDPNVPPSTLKSWPFVSVTGAPFTPSAYTRGVYLGLGDWEMDNRVVRAYAVRGTRFIYLDLLPHAMVEQWRALLPGEEVLIYAGSDSIPMSIRLVPKNAP